MRKIVVMGFLMLVAIPTIVTTVDANGTIGNLILTGASTTDAPSMPVIAGPTDGEIGEQYEYTITSIDPQGDDVYYVVIFSDMPAVWRSDFYKSGEVVSFTHRWSDFYQSSGEYTIRAKAVDVYGHESEWSVFTVNIENDNDAVRERMVMFSFIRELLMHLQTIFDF